MARNTRTYSDLDFNFTAHPVTGDIVRRFDESAVKAALKNLILTSNYERPFHSEIGSPIKRLLFEPATPMLQVMLQRAITDTVNNFEPRAKLIDVNLIESADNNTIEIGIYFSIVNVPNPVSVQINLERVR